MQILTAGRAVSRWPVGVRVTCANCGLVGVIEEGDEVRVVRLVAGSEARVACPNCGTEVAVPRAGDAR